MLSYLPMDVPYAIHDIAWNMTGTSRIKTEYAAPLAKVLCPAHNEVMEDHTEPPPAHGNADAAPMMTTRDWLRVARGFSCVLWSIPLGLFLSTGAVDLAASRYFRLPTYIFAVILFLWGLILLHRVPRISRRWNRYLRQGFMLVLLLIYFAPFIHWWSLHPQTNHFMINVFGMALATAWLLWMINRLSGEVAAALQNRILLIESRLCGWAVGTFMITPMLLYFTYALIEAARRNVSLYWIILDLRHFPLATFILALLLLPLTLTIAIAWKTKEQALRALRNAAEQRG